MTGQFWNGAAVGGTCCLFSRAAFALNEPERFNLAPGATGTSVEIFHLHNAVLLVCTLIAIGVFSIIGYTLWRYRRPRHAVPDTFKGNRTIEIIWTAIPLAILVIISIPATRVLLEMARDIPTELTIEVRGSQWKWHYRYMHSDLGFYSNLKTASRDASSGKDGARPQLVDYYLRDVDNPLVLPTGRPIRLQITSDDVIHSWWVPALGIKRDAVPGYLNRVHFVIDKPGIYRGQCSELCGTGHAFMPIVVKALPPDEFDAWRSTAEATLKQSQQEEATTTWTMDGALKRGEKVFGAICAACHQASGEGVPGVFPALKGSKVATGPLGPHLDIVIHGSKRNPIMRPWGEQLDDRDLAGVITYERNAWGNQTGDLVLPQQVKEAR